MKLASKFGTRFAYYKLQSHTFHRLNLRATILDRSLSVRPGSSPLLVSNIVGEGEGLPIRVMSLVIVSKIACQRIFVLSDPGVQRTFVVVVTLVPSHSHRKQILPAQ